MMKRLLSHYLVLVTGALFLIILGRAQAATPAGYVIANQAVASYSISGQTFTVTSNLVETIVAPTAGVTLTSSQTQYTNPGTLIYIPHQVTNTGNTSDTFNLTTGTPSGGFTVVGIYADANGDGVPDNTTAITATPILTAGHTYNIVVGINVPTSVTVGNSNTVTVTATSQLNSSVLATNTDTVNYVATGVIAITKSMTPANVVPGQQVTVTLTYTNTGNLATGTVTVTDTLPTQLTYVAGSTFWSNSTSALNDSGTGNPSGITFSVTGRQISAAVPAMSPGITQTLTFRATVASTAPNNAAGTISNTAGVNYISVQPSTALSVASNIATVVVQNQPAVSVTDVGSTTDNRSGAASGDGFVDPAGPFLSGSSVLFDNVILNNGNLTDSFNMQINNVNYPTGTSFILLKADGITPLADSNNDGIVDTGPVVEGASYHVWVRAQLPPGTSGTGPYTATLTATSITSSTVTASIIDRINAITAETVDLTNTATGTDGGTGVADGGWGPGPETVAQVVATTAPGATATFDLYINQANAGVLTSYYLEYSTSPTFTTVNTLPTGWTAQFQDTNGNIISQASLAPATAQYHYRAYITVPATAAPGNQAVYFRVRAVNNSSLQDVIYDQVTVSTVNSVALEGINIGQLIPGGTQVYSHLLSNYGNVTVTSGAITTASNLAGWNVTLYLDSDGNGVFDPNNDVILTNISQISGGLAPGRKVVIFVRVQAPANALPTLSQITTTTLTVTSNTNASTSVTDNTLVISGDITLSKMQALDANCNLTAATASFTANVITAVNAGQCILYRTTATNTSSVAATQLQITDQTPQYTILNGTPSVSGTATGGTVTTTSVSGGTQITANWATIPPGQTAIVVFRAQVN